MPLTRKDTQRQTRDRLIAAAHSSIVEEGVAAMSIRNICSAAGHSQGAFYSNFASKDDLLVEILQSHIQDEVTLLRDLVAHCSGDDIEATLQVLAARLAKLADEAQWSLLSIELQLHARRDPAFAERHREGKAACYRMFGELVADLTQRFALRPTLPPMQTGIGLYTLWMGMAVQGAVEGAMPRDEMLVGFFRVMAGLGASHEEQAYS
ncbi:MAG: TetR/AcrR family transcriptional regulator [Azospirillum brasilense]|uniref:TetR/AcrR family transcriptional regulator n=1 Tax=Roseomonas mucosa TaxID=207340 RepID=UPI000DB852F0|nr:TetR/AcrR family transcriptional regulator [Roseomonas mucosa]PZP38741.1 MAG: TetR/AcrR family transcriptional regulator [Azospirillum brasilense]QDD97076.1 Transcriptional regulator, TetR family [Roseomonas mucosa]QET91466.1 TetR/AcrR family transcriptional regulator [Roseomonas mucosa]